MQGNKYKFYIKNQGGYWYYIDDLDTVQLSLTKREIVYAPKGWQEMTAQMLHNTKYKGNFKKVTTPIHFVLDGKKIIDYIATYEGTEGYADFIIEVQVADDFSYTLFFNGTIDFFDGYKYGEFSSTANIKEQTLLDILDAKSDVVYEIPLTDLNSVNVQEDGLNLTYKTLYSVNNGFLDGSHPNGSSHIVELTEASNENLYTKGTKREKFYLPLSNITGNKQPFYNSPVAGALNIVYNFTANVKWFWSLIGFNAAPGSKISWNIVKVDLNNIATLIPIYVVNGRDLCFGNSAIAPGQPGVDHVLNNSISVNTNAGDKLYFVFLTENNNPNYDNGTQVVYREELTTEFIVSSLQRAPATLHKGILPYKLAQELVTKSTDGRFGCISPFLFADENKILIPGSSLRKDAVVSIKTTIGKFLKYVYVNHLGVITDTIGNNCEIKHLKDTFLDAESMDLGNVADFEWEFSKEHAIGNVKVGYENIDFGVDNQINGKDEFNQTNHFTTGQEKIKAEYDIVSPYIASMYAHELLRVNFGNRKTTDNKSDNEVFILDAEKGTDVKYFQGLFETIAGNTIKILGILPILPNGTKITIVGAAANNGVFTITNTSLITSGFTTITVAETVTTSPNLAGTIQYFDSNVYHPRRLAYASITGLLDSNSAFNIELSPKHLVLLHAPVISAGIFNSNANASLDTLKFQSGDKNVLLRVSFDNISFITENTDEIISSLPQPYYLPIALNFTTDYRNDLFVFLDSLKKYQHIGFNWNGFRLNGYIRDIISNPDNNEKMRWKLLMTTSSNLVNIL